MIENPCVYDSAGDEIGVDEKYLTDLKNLLDEKAKLGKNLSPNLLKPWVKKMPYRWDFLINQ